MRFRDVFLFRRAVNDFGRRRRVATGQIFSTLSSAIIPLAFVAGSQQTLLELRVPCNHVEHGERLRIELLVSRQHSFYLSLLRRRRSEIHRTLNSFRWPTAPEDFIVLVKYLPLTGFFPFNATLPHKRGIKKLILVGGRSCFGYLDNLLQWRWEYCCSQRKRVNWWIVWRTTTHPLRISKLMPFFQAPILSIGYDIFLLQLNAFKRISNYASHSL